jgi:RNA polymerase sigma factor (sigma-70 family)
MSGMRTADAGTPWDGLTGADRYAACLLAARAGNRNALDVLVAELTPLVWHVVRGNHLDRCTAEDVVQTVWLALLRHLDRLTEPHALVAWLITTARREARRCLRSNQERQQRMSGELNDDHISTMDYQPEVEALREERDRRLWTAFFQLSQRCQELLRLTVLAGRAEYSMVAEALHMPRGSIGPTRGRCLGSLRELLEGEGDSL